jgi:hypothetical protein
MVALRENYRNFLTRRYFPNNARIVCSITAPTSGGPAADPPGEDLF